MSFDWQTEDDAGWDEPDFASFDPGKKSGGKRRLWRWLVVVGLLVLVLAAGWGVNRRVQAVTVRVEADVLASYDLAGQAVAEQDGELFQSVLSGRDGQWSAGLTEAVVRGDLTDRSGLGLLSLPATDLLTPTIEVQADLQEAEVTTVVPYAIEIGNGLTETVQLAQTAVYRLGSNRWLLSPPDLSYWGDMLQAEGQYVTLSYPERDEVVAQALLLSLDEKIGQLCAQFQDVACPDGYHVVVELVTDPAELSQMDLLPVVRTAAQQHIILPTPTLVGLPLDRAGEQALFRGYGRLAAAAVLTDLWGYACCDDAVALHFAVLEDRLRQLGLQAWPGLAGAGTSTLLSASTSTLLSAGVSPKAYETLVKEGLPLLFSNLNTWGEAGGGAFWLADGRAEALVAFAQAELGIGGRKLVQNLPDLAGNGLTIGDWLRNLSQTSLSDQEMEDAWFNFVTQNSAAVP